MFKSTENRSQKAQLIFALYKIFYTIFHKEYKGIEIDSECIGINRKPYLFTLAT